MNRRIAAAALAMVSASVGCASVEPFSTPSGGPEAPITTPTERRTATPTDTPARSASATASTALGTPGPTAAASASGVAASLGAATPTAGVTEPADTASPIVSATPDDPAAGLVLDWQPVPEPGLGSVGTFKASAARDGRFVVIGDRTDEFLPGIWTSGDGRSWERAEFPDADDPGVTLVGVAAAQDAALPGTDGGFVVAASTADFGMEATVNSHVYTSADGRSWTRHDPETWAGVEIRTLVGGGEWLVAFGIDAAGEPAAWTSPTGTEWRYFPVSGARAVAGGLLDVQGTADGYVALRRGPGQPSPEIEVWRSSSGSDWNRIAALPDSANASSAWLVGGPLGWSAVAGLERRQATEWRAWTSADAVSWQSAVNAPTHVSDLFGDAAGFIAAGYHYPGGGCAIDETQVQGLTWTSVDGSVWRQMPEEGWFGRQIDLLRRYNRTLIGIGFDWTRNAGDPLADNGAVWTAQLPDSVADTGPPPPAAEPVPGPGC